MEIDDTPPRGDIFDGFEEYRTPQTEDYHSVLTEGLVVLDANVLLNLYRYNKSARDDLLSVMDRIGDHLWVPHRAMWEFWQNRESTLGAPGDAAEEVLKSLNGYRTSAEQAITVWTKKSSLPERRRAALHRRLERAFAVVTQFIEQQADLDAHVRDTNEDDVLLHLSKILHRRIGNPLQSDDYKAALEEAEKRIKAGQPPGFKDKDKASELRVGDYLVWEQLLREAETRKCDALFVTGDMKEDWWVEPRSSWRGPRRELAAEFRKRTGRHLFMLRPQDLLRYASSLNVKVDLKSVDEVTRVGRSWEGSSQSQYEQIVPEVYRQADMVDWHSLSAAGKSAQYQQWVEHPDVGRVLYELGMSRDRIRVYLKDVVMKEYPRALEGVGRFTIYSSKRHDGPEQIVRAVCGDDWAVEPGSLSVKPTGCRVTDGDLSRYIFWGPPAAFKDLVWSALSIDAPTIDEPIVVILLREGEAVADRSRDRYIRIAEQAGVELCYLTRSLIPNPDFQSGSG